MQERPLRLSISVSPAELGDSQRFLKTPPFACFPLPSPRTRVVRMGTLSENQTGAPLAESTSSGAQRGSSVPSTAPQAGLKRATNAVTGDGTPLGRQQHGGLRHLRFPPAADCHSAAIRQNIIVCGDRCRRVRGVDGAASSVERHKTTTWRGVAGGWEGKREERRLCGVGCLPFVAPWRLLALFTSFKRGTLCHALLCLSCVVVL